MKYLPQQPFLRPDGFRSNGAQYAELRGLGADTTLVLINGRRAFASAASFAVNAFDLNHHSSQRRRASRSAFDSTSVRHGMDAIGGILNIVLRDDIPHPSVAGALRLRAGRRRQLQAAVSGGYEGDGVKAAVILDYTRMQTLFGVERELWANQDYRRYGSVDQRSTISSPAT